MYDPLNDEKHFIETLPKLWHIIHAHVHLVS